MFGVFAWCPQRKASTLEKNLLKQRDRLETQLEQLAKTV